LNQGSLLHNILEVLLKDC